MSLSQIEADQLLQMPKVFADNDPLQFSQTLPMDYDRVLRSADRREEFILTIERGQKKNIRLKYQTQARRVIVLARLELKGPRHRNPPESPYRPGEWVSGMHLHLYREKFEDRIAYELADAPGWKDGTGADGMTMLEHFLRFCCITHWPPIQTLI